MKKKPVSLLASITPFDVLAPKEIRDMERRSFKKHFQRGDTIFVEGSSSRTVWIVKAGRVHLATRHFNGKISTICVKAEGDLLCGLPALDRGNYPATAIAKEATRLIGVPSEVFSALMARHPRLSRKLVAMLCRCLRHAEETAASHTFGSAEKRVVNVLVTLAEKFGPEIPLTREEIAELCGLAVETVIRTTSRLKIKNLLSSNGKKSLRVDAEKLHAHLESLNMI